MSRKAMVRTFISEICQYAAITEPDEALLRRLILKICHGKKGKKPTAVNGQERFWIRLL